MAQQTISTTISGEGTAVSLDTADQDLLLTATGILESTQGDGIDANSVDHDLIIEGHITALFSGIALGFASGGLRNTLTVEATGEIFGGTYGVIVDGAQTTVENDGLIESDGSALVFVTGETGTSSLVNSGTIRGTAAIDYTGSEVFSITNTGLLEATEDYAFFADTTVKSGDITFLNSGEIIGTVFLGDGSDVFDGAEGTIEGTINGREGDDRLTAGVGANFIIGGLGRDVLAGGSGPDHFIFEGATDSGSTKKSMDRITDFSRQDGDIIDLHDIDAKKGGTDGDDFKFIKDDEFHDRKGELRYEIGNNKTYVQADYDGDGEADFAIMLTGEIELKKGDFEL